MIYFLAFVVIVLAVARLTRVIVIDDIGLPLRQRVLTKWPLPSKPGKLVTCYWCAGFWMSGLAALAAHTLFPWNPFLAVPLLTLATSYAVGVVLDMEERANGIGA